VLGIDIAGAFGSALSLEYAELWCNLVSRRDASCPFDGFSYSSLLLCRMYLTLLSRCQINVALTEILRKNSDYSFSLVSSMLKEMNT
jgi:hypothetical protein